jgi:hypothetical protein
MNRVKTVLGVHVQQAAKKHSTANAGRLSVCLSYRRQSVRFALILFLEGI